MSLLDVERIDVGERRLEALVRVRDPERLKSSAYPAVAERLLALLPGLKRHRCENGTARGMAAELADTELPHLLEHVAFELMVLSGSPRDLHGETLWDFERDGRGVFRVRLGFDVDTVALGALKEALAVVDWACEPGSAVSPDVDGVIARLSAIREHA